MIKSTRCLGIFVAIIASIAVDYADAGTAKTLAPTLGVPLETPPLVGTPPPNNLPLLTPFPTEPQVDTPPPVMMPVPPTSPVPVVSQAFFSS